MTYRRLDADHIVLATHNAGKVREIGALLEPFGLRVQSAADLNLPEPEETGDTFEANAALKALAAAQGSGVPALADDSGLCIRALNDEPGIYSARWAGPEKDFKIAIQKVETELAGHEDRRAYFVCVMALAWPDGHVEVFRGETHGTLVFPPRGAMGFGYDPIFVPGGADVTFGEMSQEEKERLSHRTKAFEALVAGCMQVK